MQDSREVGMCRVEGNSPDAEQLGDVDIEDEVRGVIGYSIRRSFVSLMSRLIPSRPGKWYIPIELTVKSIWGLRILYHL